jgi:hypothetical protein
MTCAIFIYMVYLCINMIFCLTILRYTIASVILLLYFKIIGFNGLLCFTHDLLTKS